MAEPVHEILQAICLTRLHLNPSSTCSKGRPPLVRWVGTDLVKIATVQDCGLGLRLLFDKDLATTQSPLHQSTQIDKIIKRTHKCAEAFEQLWTALTQVGDQVICY